MKRHLCFLWLLITAIHPVCAQYNSISDDGEVRMAADRNHKNDSTKNDKEIPKGIFVWTVDERFGDRTIAEVDTMPHLFMNSAFTTGMYGEYNTTGNLGAPRINRIFVDRSLPQQFMFTQPYDYFLTPVGKFHFTNTYSPITNLNYQECGDKNNGEDHLKALFAVNAGKRIGLGMKFDYIYGRGYFQNQSTAHFNYSLYGSYLGDRYEAHLLFSTNHQKVAENGGITDDRYITHQEIFEDEFNDNEIPTVLEKNWNRNDNLHVFLTHRYNVGFNRKVPMTEEEIKAKKFAMEAQKEENARKAKEKAQRDAERDGRSFDEEAFDNQKTYSGRPDDAKVVGNEPAQNEKPDEERIAVNGKEAADSLMAKEIKEEEDTSWLKNEFVPVTSFIHTASLDNYSRIYQAYDVPSGYYANTYDIVEELSGDSIYDKMRHLNLKNTFAISLLEGFNKWAKAGVKAFISSDLRHFNLPDTVASGFSSYNEHNISVGGQISKTQGNTLHYSATAETWLVGEDAGQLKIDGTADVNFRLFGDTVRLAAKGYFYRLNPTFFQRKYHSKHFWWDNSELSKEIRTRVEGLFSYTKTRTKLRVAVDAIKNYTYFAHQYTITANYGRTGNSVNVQQSSDNISVLTAQLSQDFTFGPLNWESVITYQQSSDQSVLPLPKLNIYSTLYFHFVINKVLKVDLGGDVRYFTKYYAPDYCPGIGQYTVQKNGDANIELGNYPIVNVFANMHLKHTRFYVMMSHVNAAKSAERFYTPHYPLNGNVLRLGVSWNFFN